MPGFFDGWLFRSSAWLAGIFPPMFFSAMLLDSGPMTTNVITRFSFSGRNATTSILCHEYPFYWSDAWIRVYHLFACPCNIRHMVDYVGNCTGLRSIDCCTMPCLDMSFDLRGDSCEFAPSANHHPIFSAMYKQLVELPHGEFGGRRFLVCLNG